MFKDNKNYSIKVFNELFKYCKADLKSKGNFFQILVYGNKQQKQTLPDSLYKSFAEGKDYQVAIPKKYVTIVKNTLNDDSISKQILGSVPRFDADSFFSELYNSLGESDKSFISLIEGLDEIRKGNMVDFWKMIRRIIFLPESFKNYEENERRVLSIEDYKNELIETIESGKEKGALSTLLNELLNNEKELVRSKLIKLSEFAEASENHDEEKECFVDWFVYNRNLIKKRLVVFAEGITANMLKSRISRLQYIKEDKWFDEVERFREVIVVLSDVADMLYNALYFIILGKSFDLVVSDSEVLPYDGFLPKRLSWEDCLGFVEFARAYGISSRIGRRELLHNVRTEENPMLMYEYGISLHFDRKREALKWLYKAARNGSNNALWDLGFFVQNYAGSYKYVGKRKVQKKDIYFLKNMKIGTSLFVEAARMGMAQAYNSLANNVHYIEITRKVSIEQKTFKEIKPSDISFRYPLLSKEIYRTIVEFVLSMTNDKSVVEDSYAVKRFLYLSAVNKKNKNAMFNIAAMNIKRIKYVLLEKYEKKRQQSLSTRGIRDEITSLLKESLTYLEESANAGLSESARLYALIVRKNSILDSDNEEKGETEIRLFEKNADLFNFLPYSFAELDGKCKNLLLNIIVYKSNSISEASYVKECEDLYRELYRECVSNAYTGMREAVVSDVKGIVHLLEKKHNMTKEANKSRLKDYVEKMLYSNNQTLLVYEKENQIIAMVCFSILYGYTDEEKRIMLLTNYEVDEKCVTGNSYDCDNEVLNYKRVIRSTEMVWEAVMEYCKSVAKENDCLNIMLMSPSGECRIIR